MKLKNFLYIIKNEKSLMLFINKNKISGPLWYKNPIKINRTLTPMYVIKKKLRWNLPNNFYTNQTNWLEPFIKQNLEKFIFKDNLLPAKDDFFEAASPWKIKILFLKNIFLGWLFFKKWGFKWFRLKRSPLPNYKLYIATKISSSLPECKLRYYGFQSWPQHINFEKRFKEVIFLIKFYILEIKQNKNFPFYLVWHCTQLLNYFLPGLYYKLFFRYLKDWSFFFKRSDKNSNSFFTHTKITQDLTSIWLLILIPYWPLQNEVSNGIFSKKRNIEKKRITEQKKFLKRWQNQTWLFFYKKSFYLDNKKKLQYYLKRLHKQFKNV